uniref:Gustatory receptor n=1 Tax=Culex quinquefasciatus TaxID=7176 RepID=A0A1S4JNF3_CULQU
HWEIVLIVVVIHNCLKFRKLDRFIDTIYQIEQKIVILENRRSFLILKCLVGASVTVRIIFLTYSFTQSTMLVMNEICTTFNDLLFDLYNLHVLVQVWCLRRCFKTLNRRFIDALTSGEFNMIFEVLQLTDQLYTALRIFNGYYGLFMLGVCLVAFIRTSLATYLAMLALLERWDGGRVIFVIVLTVGSYTIFNCGIVYAIFYVCHTTIDEANETVLCTRNYHDYNVADNRTTRQINKFLLKNLHQKKKFSAYGFFDIDNSVIYMIFSSIVTYLVILVQFKQLETELDGT